MAMSRRSSSRARTPKASEPCASHSTRMRRSVNRRHCRSRFSLQLRKYSAQGSLWSNRPMQRRPTWRVAPPKGSGPGSCSSTFLNSRPCSPRVPSPRSSPSSRPRMRHSIVQAVRAFPSHLQAFARLSAQRFRVALLAKRSFLCQPRHAISSYQLAWRCRRSECQTPRCSLNGHVSSEQSHSSTIGWVFRSPSSLDHRVSREYAMVTRRRSRKRSRRKP